MKKTLVYFLTVILALVMLAAPVFAAEEAAMEEPGPLKVGDMLSDDLMVTTLDGKSITLKSAAKSPYTAFQFMTTACSACQQELIDLLGVRKDVGSDKFEIIPISVDMAGGDAVKAYEAKNEYKLTYLLDSMFELPPRFNFAYTPSFLVVDSSGKIVYIKGGYMKSRWKKDVVQLKDALK